MKYKPLVEVCFSPEQYSLYGNNFDIVVVIDVLRATSVICTAFHYGVKKIIPIVSIDVKERSFIFSVDVLFIW